MCGRLVCPMDLGCVDDDNHDRDDKIYMQAGERNGSASEPLSPGFEAPIHASRLRTIHNRSSQIRWLSRSARWAWLDGRNSLKVPFLCATCFSSCTMAMAGR